MRSDILTEDERAERLQPLLDNGWAMSGDRDQIEKQFTFTNFRIAFGWMTVTGMEAEKMNHHPDWTNVWNRVNVKLTTFNKGGLTDLDVRLAKRMDKLAEQFSG
ncbi:MAG: 4a-hydroxytetrahydrobiopterin dehydratase [Paracoccaceae bacterium]|nr:4a-hydroxytetrahydrobiopterin dehydratase [Paracoccaceae bacterium]MDG2258093.1 4a-hydroxytetrahydrobiopterin dehydratase [Paracoccaceae bacterium]